jgi:hypothetical protein
VSSQPPIPYSYGAKSFDEIFHGEKKPLLRRKKKKHDTIIPIAGHEE